VIETFANLIHERRRAGIMVTHDLRMCVYADRILQMEDGRLIRTLIERAEIEAFCSAGPVRRPAPNIARC
jgi:putative ABC transport system ATP-binding protein